MSALRVAIVGCGRMGQARWSAARQLGAQVVVLSDSDLARARALAQQAPTAMVLETPAALPWESIDAVFVCTPPYQRGLIELQAIQNGIHVFMEKPIGLSAEQCLPLLQVLRENPVVTAVGYMNRYRSSMDEVRKLLADSEIRGVSGNWVCGPYRVPWWDVRTMSGGPVNEQATHIIDLCRFLVGEITEVQAMAYPVTTEKDRVEAAAINLCFANNVLGSIFYSCAAEEKMIELRLFTAQEQIRLSGWDFSLSNEQRAAAHPPADRNSIFVDEVQAFFEAITKGVTDTVRSNLFDAFETQRVIDTVRRSLHSRTVERVT